MKKIGIRFDELRELLRDLGFIETQEKARLRFVHAATDMVLLFRIYRPKEIVQPRDMLVVRRQLVDNGLIEASALERFMQQAIA